MLCYTQNNVASELITNKMINGICYNIWTNLTSESDYAYVTCPQNGDYTGEITIPDYIYYGGKKYPVTKIGYLAFCYDKVTKVTIPNSIKEIETNAFLNCQYLSELKIPASVEKIGKSILGGCQLSLIIETDKITNWYSALSGLSSYSKIYTHYSQIDYISRAFSGTIINIDTPYWIEFRKTYLKGVKFNLYENKYYTKEHSLKGINIDEKSVELQKNNTYFVKGLPLNMYGTSSSTVTISYIDENLEEKSLYYSFKLPTPSTSYSISSSYNSLTASIKTSSDETATPKTAMFYVMDESYNPYSADNSITNGQAIIKIEKLMPNSSYDNAVITITYEEDDGYCPLYKPKTKYTTAKYPCYNLRPTVKANSISVLANYPTLSKDINITKALIFIYGGEKQKLTANAETHLFKGLKPNKEYSIGQTLYCGDKIIGESITNCKTNELELITENPYIVTPTSAIIAAKTNIGEEEEQVGFEWRKTDAPDVVVSKSGSGVVYGGMLEGRINNLSTSSYYKVRPFYKASDGTMYYGEWIGFDPSDFSYFEPTVHTYTRASVQSTSAKVKGVALQGTDDITEQGFEYWAENAIASRAAGDKQIIQATGQSMEAEITDLAPNTTYNYRAYAKTSKGTTYGETLKFTTPVATAIIGITNTTNSDLQFNVKNTNNVQIAINGTDKECNYRMNSITGANIASGKTTADGEWHTIANYQLPSGIYIITVSDGKDKKSTKIAIK